MPVINGVLLHAIGASCAALCYTPQKKTCLLVVANLLAGTGHCLLAATPADRGLVDNPEAGHGLN